LLPAPSELDVKLPLIPLKDSLINRNQLVKEQDRSTSRVQRPSRVRREAVELAI
jgi:hypothetical protein